MKGKIPKIINDLYKNADWRARIYMKLRWSLCPFEEIERRVPQKGTILDLGCGYGLLANFLAVKSPERQVVGIDLSQRRIDIARSTIGSRHNIKFINQNLKELSIESFDGAVMSDFFHHFPKEDADRLLRHLYQKLSPPGKIIIQEVDSASTGKYVFTLLLDKFLSRFSPLYFRSAKDWKDFLENIGFKVEVVFSHRLFLPDIILICSKLR